MCSNNRQFSSSLNGFSLLEALIALAIFAVGVLGTLAFNGIVLASNDLTGSAVNAQALARGQLENLLVLPSAAPELQPCAGGPGDFCYVDTGSGVMGSVPGGAVPADLDVEGNPSAAGRFQREWNIANVGGANPLILQVRVRWRDLGHGATQSGFGRSVVLSTTL